ncbi:MAG: hypothetical protein EB075_14950, partial [Bacteroidetes bacterium]|nr:hypothetical protein [Bacteroidota bacterium]
DLFWKQKGILISVGAALVSINLLIMFGLVQHTSDMVTVLSVEAWYIVGTLLASVGYLLQDVVADAMTVDAVPTVDDEGNSLDETTIKAEHVTLQSLAQFVLIGAAALVAAINMTVFQGGNSLSDTHTHQLYANIYLYTLISPLISVCAVGLAAYLACAKAQVSSRRRRYSEKNTLCPQKKEVNWNIFLASGLLIVFAAVLTALKIPFSQEILFLGLAFFVLFLMRRVTVSLPKNQTFMMVGIAVLVFMPGATPHPGPSPNWFSIDQLLFDEQFFSYLFFLSTLMALVGIVVLRPLLIKASIARVMVLLAIVTTVLSLPNIGMCYGLHHWTSSVTGGLVDARFIALIDTAALSPFIYLTRLPLLAWVAQNA